jgi:hypothetical protein
MPTFGLTEKSFYACICLVCDAGDYAISLWLYAFGGMARLVAALLSKGDEVNVIAEARQNRGRHRVVGIGTSNLLVITEIEVNGEAYQEVMSSNVG